MRASDYKEFSGLKSKSTKKVKPKKASKVVTQKMLTDKGFSNDKEGLRDFMNTFKYDEDKGYVKRSKGLLLVQFLSKAKGLFMVEELEISL